MPFISKALTGVAAAALGLALTGSPAWPAGAESSNDSSVPAIAGVLNNYSYVLPGAVNYGIAPGSIFVIFGTGMATPGVQAVLQDSTKGLPLTLNGASVAVTVSGLTVHPALYYATPTQIAAVLPSNTPPGTGTVTVTFNGVTSAPAETQVVLSAPGLATMSGDGTGPVMATDANYHFISPTASAASGQIITLWGTGLGADTADSDTTYTATPHQITTIPLTIYVGSTQVQVVWAGRSGYPGLDQINIQLPVLSQDLTGNYIPVPVGCSVQLTAVGNGVGSNTVTLPVTMAGGACMHPSFVLDPSVAQTYGGRASVNFGSLSVSQYGSQAMAGGSFDTIPGAALAAYASSGTASAGSCIVVPPAGTYPSTWLFVGYSLTVTGPAGQQTFLSNSTGDYGGPLPASWTPSTGESFTFLGGTFPSDTGIFSTNVNFPAPLEWANQDSIGVISRSQGVPLTWTGGDSDGVVAIRGSSFTVAGSQTPGTSFMCSVPASAGQFTVPSSVLQSLPAGRGTLTVENQAAPQGISATGLDIVYAFASASLTINAAYN